MYTVKILRQDEPNAQKYYQSFRYSGDAQTVAQMLNELNKRVSLTDIDGEQARPVEWECSCLSKKCGACAMLINGIPRLACSAFLNKMKGRTITLEPLSKFPVIRDLIVDRSYVFEMVKKLNLWLENGSWGADGTHEQRYNSAKCIMCGCCLEVCPNFSINTEFAGAAAHVNAFRILDQLRDSGQIRTVAGKYIKYYFEGCGKSLACHNICPLGIPVEELMVRSNSIAVWKR